MYAGKVSLVGTSKSKTLLASLPVFDGYVWSFTYCSWDMDDLAQHFKKKLMCTCSTVLMPGKTNKNKEIIVQGHHLDKVRTELVEKYGVPEDLLAIRRA